MRSPPVRCTRREYDQYAHTVLAPAGELGSRARARFGAMDRKKRLRTLTVIDHPARTRPDLPNCRASRVYAVPVSVSVRLSRRGQIAVVLGSHEELKKVIAFRPLSKTLAFISIL